MRLISPGGLHYPVTVTKLLRKADDLIDRNAPLFDYIYKSYVLESSEEDKDGQQVLRSWPSTFESYVEGNLTRWYIESGQVITRKGTPIAEIEEACRHEVQFGGMCANCGKDMTTVAYNTVTRDTSRATVNTVHGHTALLISQAEASRSDEEAKRRLISSRKLSLVVDLDQTIIHATVDPTVGEWQNDPNNPNHDAVKDVQAFQLVDDGPGARGCWYYIKLRPGLKDFLETISKYYELHIYTMGTRAYAQNIAKIVDPDRKIFADRILSRDESGSMTVKNLKRLFPVDTKMVVIIDDRGDVWHWSQNLIKVTPYDFFVGIGDINSSFLPKRPELEAAPPKPKPASDGIAKQDHAPVNGTSPDQTSKPPEGTPEAPAKTAQGNGDLSAIDQLMSMGGSKDAGTLREQTSQQDEAIAAQLADRPLLQKQKILDAVEDDANKAESESPTEDQVQDNQDSNHDAHSRYRSNLLIDNDTELKYLQRSLRSVHQNFYEEYDKEMLGSHGGRIAELRPGHNSRRSADDMGVLPDVQVLMAAMKGKVLRGASLVFSGVVPLGIDIQRHDLAVWAKSFGAAVTENITKRTTHVIASPHRRTAKVRQAAKKPDRIKIVTQHWLFDSLSQWRRVDERPYRIHVDIADEDRTAGTADGSPFDEPDNIVLSSSDEEAALTEEEAETPLTLQTDLDNDTKIDAELAQHAPTLSREDSSPHEVTEKEWDDMNDELADFLGSDAEDGSDSDAESTAGSTKSDTSEASTPTTSSAKKRKRPDKDDATTDGEDSDASATSKLQKRKRKALARTSSLNNFASVNDPALLKASKDKETHRGGTIVEENGGDGEDTDGDLEAQLEAEMLKQLEEDGDEA